MAIEKTKILGAIDCGLEGCEFESLPSHISFTHFQKALKIH